MFKTKKRKYIQERAIKHYDTMIKAAQTFPGLNPPDPKKMRDAVHQDWYGSFCSYCMSTTSWRPFISRKCRMGSGIFFKRCNSSKQCCGGHWYRMSLAPTWNVWIEHAIKVRNYIKDHG